MNISAARLLCCTAQQNYEDDHVMKTRADKEAVGQQIVDAVLKVHQALGPGLLESAYQACLAYELRQRELAVDCEVIQPITYEDIRIDAGYRIDMLIEGCVIVENKAVRVIEPIHTAQILTYMRLRNISLGYLINWNVALIKYGIKRMVNNH